MTGVELLDGYVTDIKAFRQRIRACKDVKALHDFLRMIAEANKPSGSQFTYKLTCTNNNKHNLPFEDFDISEKTGKVKGYFYLQGTRTYKDIHSFSYNVKLIKYSYWDRSFSVTLY